MAQGGECTDGGAAIDRLFAALAAGDPDAAAACFTADAVIWHGFDRTPHDLASIAADWRGLIAHFPRRAFVDVRRQATADGFVQQHLMVAETASGQRKAWPVCIVVRMEQGLIARLDEYIDRAGSFEPEAVDDLATPGMAPVVQPPPPTFRIFRAADAPGLVESGCMAMAPITDVQRAGMKRIVEAGYLHGDEIAVLYDAPGFSLTYAWLKRDYPLILHSHDSDCLYYVVAGELRLGTETLGPRDGFFVPAGAPYTYRPGPDGVEVLEFRHVGRFNFVNLSKNAAFYDKAAETIAAACADWRAARRPSERVG